MLEPLKLAPFCSVPCFTVVQLKLFISRMSINQLRQHTVTPLRGAPETAEQCRDPILYLPGLPPGTGIVLDDDGKGERFPVGAAGVPRQGGDAPHVPRFPVQVPFGAAPLHAAL